MQDIFIFFSSFTSSSSDNAPKRVHFQHLSIYSIGENIHYQLKTPERIDFTPLPPSGLLLETGRKFSNK